MYDVNREEYLPRKSIAGIIAEMYGSDFLENEEAVAYVFLLSHASLFLGHKRVSKR